MFRDLIALPFRIGACAAHVGVRLTDSAAAGTLSATRWLLAASGVRAGGAAGTDGANPPSSLRSDIVMAPPPSISETPSTAAHYGRTPATADVRRAASIPPSLPVPRAVPTGPEVGEAPKISPAHVSEGLQFVEAFAEPGAEEGAGASVHVQEPWNGYREMTANEVIARLAKASREELAAVELYERGHRDRQTIVAAADRQLRRATAAARQRN